ncbi:MAG: RHS repeat-associated core domain-containing protein [Lachnoclostridium sp.]
MYYLGSRYYDPVTGRFVNADDVETLDINTESLEGYNLYAYCNDDPVNLIDDDGHLPKWAKHMIVGTAVIAAAAVLTVATAGTEL